MIMTNVPIAKEVLGEICELPEKFYFFLESLVKTGNNFF